MRSSHSRLAIVSGYFNPLHLGHLRLFQDAADRADGLVVIVNNDEQQMLKKGRIIMPESHRVEIVRALRIVDDVVLSVDEDPPVIESLQLVRRRYPMEELLFCNGGDRNCDAEIPEAQICRELGIEVAFGVGGDFKTDSSTRVVAAMT